MDYKTTDIVLAATLRVEGYELSGIELQGNKGMFVFYDVEQEVIDDFDLGKCRVEPTTFNSMVKQLTTSVRRMSQQR